LALQQQQIAQGGLLDTNAMLATAMLGMMAQNSGGSSSSSGLGEQGGTGITEDAFEGMRLGNMARGHTAVANLQQRPMTDPTSVLLPFIATINERGGRYREGADGYSVYQYVLTLFNLYPRILGSGQHKSIKKMLVALGWLWDLGRRQGLLEHPHSLPVMAALTQIFKVVEGAALAEGRWNDWDFLPVPDPEGTATSTAAPVENAALAALNRERQSLNSRTGGGDGQGGGGRGAAGGGHQNKAPFNKATPAVPK